MHLETYLYMLLQSDKTLPPPGARPDFQALASQARLNSTVDSWVKIQSNKIIIGQNEEGKFWTWDNEKPAREREVAAFEVRSLPLTNADYVEYILKQRSAKIPVSWVVSTKDQSKDGPILNGYADTPFAEFIKDKAVRTFYGPVPLLFALDWPVMGSYDELSCCAKSMGGRIPTMEETKSIHVTAESTKLKSLQGGWNSEPDLFVDLTGSNIGFKNFHPVPVTSERDLVGGIAPMGGAWEWTSTILEKWEGFETMPEYPAYTCKCFDFDPDNLC